MPNLLNHTNSNVHVECIVSFSNFSLQHRNVWTRIQNCVQHEAMDHRNPKTKATFRRTVQFIGACTSRQGYLVRKVWKYLSARTEYIEQAPINWTDSLNVAWEALTHTRLELWSVIQIRKKKKNICIIEVAILVSEWNFSLSLSHTILWPKRQKKMSEDTKQAGAIVCEAVMCVNITFSNVYMLHFNSLIYKTLPVSSYF